MMLSSGVVAVLVDVNSATPSSACGHRCEISPVDGSSFVSPSGVPPATEQRESPPRRSGARMMNPSEPQLAPRGSMASQTGDGEPLSTETFHSFPSLKKPSQRPYGEKNGNSELSVPGRARPSL